MSLFSPLNSSPPFGLDISDLSLKLVALEKTGLSGLKPRDNGRAKIASYNSTPVPPGFFENGEIKKPDKIISLIHKIINETRGKKISTTQVISVLPETKTFIKLIEIIPSPEKDLSRMISEEMENHVPLPIDELYLDWQKISSSREEKKSGKMKILVAAAPKYIVDDYTNLLTKANLKPIALEIESVAITRCLTKQNYHRGESPPPDAALMFIDLGATRTSLIVYDKEVIQFTSSIPFSGLEITKTIAEKLKISQEQAEKSKITCGLNLKKCQGVLRKILTLNITETISKIEDALNFYKDNFPGGNPVKRILLCGGGAYFENLDQILTEKLGLLVELGNPLINIEKSISTKNILYSPILKKTHKTSIQIPSKETLSYTTAVGLALRGLSTV